MQNLELLQGINIFLIGMMGTGKTTVGQILATQLGYRFFDTDILIERVTQQSVSHLFATAGEEAFRDMESQVLKELSAYTKSVVATGGGIVLEAQNWSYLHHGLIVWLDAPVQVLEQRLTKDVTRPLLQEGNLVEKLESLLEQRRAFYAQGDLHISIDESQNPDNVVAQILEALPRVIKPKLKISQN